jgi:hypothetical protein
MAPVPVLAILETLQTVLGLIRDVHPEALEYVLTEMEEYTRQEMAGCAGQYEIVKRVMASDHVQESW